MKLSARELLIGLLFAVLVGCAHGPPKLPEADSRHGILLDAYKIEVGDQVNISVWKNPELSISEPVRPDGKIAVHLVGDVMAAGKTPEQLAEDIEFELSSYIKEPNVTVILTGLSGRDYLSMIRVTGAVSNYTPIPYRHGMTVLDAVVSAGISLYADKNRTKLHRRTKDGGTEAYDIRLKDILEDGDMSTNVMLMPGDVITIPESAF
jgi:polysaccharide export outer membrane protein